MPLIFAGSKGKQVNVDREVEIDISVIASQGRW